MDRTGLKTIMAENLKIGDIICKEVWTDDLKVLEVIKKDESIFTKTIGGCSDIHG